MPLFEDGFTELYALVIVGVIAIPSILLMLCILEECQVDMKDSLENAPIFCFQFSTADVFGNATASLMCFFFLVIVLFGCAGTAGGWYMVWRGTVASDSGLGLSDLTNGVAFLQNGTHKFGKHLHEVNEVHQSTNDWSKHALDVAPMGPKAAGFMGPDVAELVEGEPTHGAAQIVGATAEKAKKDVSFAAVAKAKAPPFGRTKMARAAVQRLQPSRLRPARGA